MMMLMYGESTETRATRALLFHPPLLLLLLVQLFLDAEAEGMRGHKEFTLSTR